MNIKICLVGATGNVGRKVATMLLERQLVTASQLTLFASSRSKGSKIQIGAEEFIIQDTIDAVFSKYTLCIFNTESDVSEQFIPKALKANCFVIDSSSQYRLDPEIPLIIPPVNKHQINTNTKLYSHANCLACPIATVLSPLHNHIKVNRVSAATYQATSGAGKVATDDCWLETKAIVNSEPYERMHFKKQIAFNVIPEVGEIREDGQTFEEFKIINELQKVVDNNIKIAVTAVRVPVMIGHSIALNLEFNQSFELNDIFEILKHAPFVKIAEENYKTPVEVVNSDDVFVGRIRRDNSISNGLQLWLCSDNLRRGAATDSVEIAEELISQLQLNHL